MVKTPFDVTPTQSAAEADAEIEQSITAYCSSTKLDVCVKLLCRRHQLTGLERILSRHGLHRSSFCLKVKQTRVDRCRDCDLRAVPERCETTRKQFTHVCHAGASEIIIPLFISDTLAAVVYIGQFRTGLDQPSELRLLTPEEQTHIESLSLLLGAYLGNQLRTPRFVSESSKNYRAASVRLFLERNLRDNPSLSDLAGHLGLSTTRTAHAVREATGRSFVSLRNELRLERSLELLSGSYHKISHIAAECGFSSPQHFHRFFRYHRGTTPLDFRQQQQMEI